jgi:hypothetical protein
VEEREREGSVRGRPIGGPAGSGPCLAAREGEREWMAGGPRWWFNEFKTIEIHFQMCSNLIWSKRGLPQPQKIEINYGWKGFEIRSNFTYRNFLKFEMDVELKIMEASMGWNSMEFPWKILGLRILMKFDWQAPPYT